MAYQPTRGNKRLATQMAELAFAVPAVMAHRLTRMALSSPTPSDRDRKEFTLMGAEKSAAMAQSFQAMSAEMFKAQQALGLSLMRSFLAPALWGTPSVRALGHQMERASTGVMVKALAPVHRKAVANAKRLSRTPLK